MGLRLQFGIVVASCLCLIVGAAHAQERKATGSDRGMKLVRSLMCEYIKAYEPQHPSVVFSINTGKISCYTTFDGIKKSTHVFHKWYRRDALVTAKRLSLKPPSWSTYSSIQLREADKGPWRVEIRNARNQLLRTLRFSITE
jgi:L-rhamnose mutarotase